MNKEEMEKQINILIDKNVKQNEVIYEQILPLLQKIVNDLYGEEDKEAYVI